MSKETVEKFYNMLKSNAGEADAFERTIVAADPKTKEEAAVAVIAFAKERGFEFTYDDLKAFANASVAEMTPEELDKLFGATSGSIPPTSTIPWRERTRADSAALPAAAPAEAGKTLRARERRNSRSRLKNF